MLLSILATRRVLSLLAGGKYLRLWHLLIFLMIFFFSGYLAVVAMIFAGLGQYIILLTGVVFLFGALFVYVVVYLGRITIEDLTKARQKAEADSRAKDAFLANMSHELRTPLNHIIGYSEIVQEEIQASGDSSLSADMASIRAAGEDMLGLVENVLELARIEDGRAGLDLGEFDISTVLHEAIEMCRPKMSRNQNRLEISIPGNLGHMYSDAAKVRHALSNILSNAAKFTEKGCVKLDASICAGGGISNPGNLVLRITDNGIGISEELIHRIFEPFERAENSSASKHAGIGLGLTITRKLCRLLGGDISIESRPNSGSVFSITLPLDARGSCSTSGLGFSNSSNGTMQEGNGT